MDDSTKLADLADSLPTQEEPVVTPNPVVEPPAPPVDPGPATEAPEEPGTEAPAPPPPVNEPSSPPVETTPPALPEAPDTPVQVPQPAEPVPAEAPKTPPEPVAPPPPVEVPNPDGLPAAVLALTDEDLKIAAAYYLKKNQSEISRKGVEARQAKMKAAMDQIVQHIKDNGPSQIPRMAQLLNLSPGLLSHYLQLLVKEGRVKGEGHSQARVYSV